MYRLFIALANPDENYKILDMGVTPDTSLVESNFFEKTYPYTHNITMSSVEDASSLEQLFTGAEFVRYEGYGQFPFPDKKFDIAFSSAVLEHVGDNERQGHFIRECARVAKKVFITTPNKLFPVDFHTCIPLIHYLPQPVHQKILRLLRQDFLAKTENLNLLSKNKLLSLIPINPDWNVRIYHNRLCGIASNLILYIET